MLQIFIHRVAHSVTNLIEQTQGTNLSSLPQTTKLALTQPFRTANNTAKQTQMRLRRRHRHGDTILEAGQNICIETALEHVDNQKISCSTHDPQIPGCLWHPFPLVRSKRQFRVKIYDFQVLTYFINNKCSMLLKCSILLKC